MSNKQAKPPWHFVWFLYLLIVVLSMICMPYDYKRKAHNRNQNKSEQLRYFDNFKVLKNKNLKPLSS